MSLSLEEALKEQGFLLRPVVGDSMMPMLDQKTDSVKIVPVTAPLKKYDLPLYKRPSGQYVLHRIIAVKKNYCVTCGDNRFESEKVPYEWIIGITQGFYKNGQYVSCEEKEYIKYARKRCRGRVFRLISGKLKRLFAKFKRS